MLCISVSGIFLRIGAAPAGAINRKTKTGAADNTKVSRYELKERDEMQDRTAA